MACSCRVKLLATSVDVITETPDCFLVCKDLEQLALFPARCHTAAFPARRLRHGLLDGLAFEGVGGVGPGRVPGLGRAAV